MMNRTEMAPGTTGFQELLALPLAELISRADRVRREKIKDRLDICSIINAKSGLCGEDCKFCAQSARHQTGVPTYSLKSKAEMVAAAEAARVNGAQRFGIVTSGNRLDSAELRRIAETISEIKNRTGLTVCASLGCLNQEELMQLRQAGLSRYHHNIETSERFYSSIVTTHSFSDRLETIRAAKAVGLEVCSGGIIGMGETWQDRLDMALMLKDLAVDAVPINVLVPVANTPLAGINPITPDDVIRTIAIFRIILVDKTVKLAAGRETSLKDFQGLAFMAGANGMIIGGYLTIRGRSVAEDQKLISDIKKLWNT